MLKNVAISVSISVALIGVTLFFVSGKFGQDGAGVVSAQSVEMKDGVQYATVTARGGYNPRIVQVAGGIPTKLVVKTNGTYDCSASLVVRAVGFQKILPPTGEEVIDLGIPKTGDKIQGVCGMGMYSFQIKVI